jgi:hypothetical protein
MVVPLIGYVDRFSGRPGERIAIKVSSQFDAPYQADMVRIVHADANPAGPAASVPAKGPGAAAAATRPSSSRRDLRRRPAAARPPPGRARVGGQTAIPPIKLLFLLKHGGAEGDRTPDLRIANATLSQLSYGPDDLDG